LTLAKKGNAYIYMARFDHKARPSADALNATIRAVNSLSGSIATLRGPVLDPGGVKVGILVHMNYRKQDFVCHEGLWKVKSRSTGHGQAAKPVFALNPATLAYLYRFASLRRSYGGWQRNITIDDLTVGQVASSDVPPAIPGDEYGGWVFGLQHLEENPEAVRVTTDPDNWGGFYGSRCDNNPWMNNPEISVSGPGWIGTDSTHNGLCSWWPLHQDWYGYAERAFISGNHAQPLELGAYISFPVYGFSPPLRLQMCDDGATIVKALAELTVSNYSRTITEWTVSEPGETPAESTTSTQLGGQLLLLGAKVRGHDPHLGLILQWVPLGASVSFDKQMTGQRVVDVTELMQAVLRYRSDKSIIQFGLVIGYLADKLDGNATVAEQMFNMVRLPVLGYHEPTDQWFPQSGTFEFITYDAINIGNIWLEIQLPDGSVAREPQYERWPRMD
jgi:hypothetical protein